MRKIKAFNIEEDVYKKLLAMFKKYKVNASLSSFVNNCLIELLSHLQDVELKKQKHPSYKVPMSFVICEMTKSLGNKKSLLSMLFQAGFPEKEMEELLEQEFLTRWENEYEAQKLGASVEMYSYIKGGKYILAPNKRYLIDKKTGKKYIAMRFDKSDETSLLELREE